jgi:mRNA interferase MazF
MTTGNGTTELRPGDVVLVPLLFTDLSDSKLRPAVVVSTEYYNRTGDDIVVTGLTSQLRREGDLHYRLVDWREAGLLKSHLS